MRRRSMGRIGTGERGGRLLSLAVLLATVGLAGPTPSPTSAEAGAVRWQHPIHVEHLDPVFSDPAASVAHQGPDRRSRVIERREQVAGRVNGRPPGPPGRTEVPALQTRLADHPRSGFRPTSLVIGRNERNTVASRLSSTLAEPAAANDGLDVLYTGNTYVSQSRDGGRSWAEVPLRAGPPDAPLPCCDLDAIHDPRRKVLFWSVLYLDPSTSNGVVGVFVRRSSGRGNACAYFIDPAGVTDDLIPDYPHLGLSDNFLYVTTSNLGSEGWSASQVRRLSSSDLATCQPTRAEVFTYRGGDQRVFVPVENASTTMFWGALETTTSFRVFSWPESRDVVSSTVQSISRSVFDNPDCRGGVGDLDFIDAPTSFSIAGFRLRGAVGGGRLMFVWNVGPDRLHPQSHVHGVVFSESTLAVLSEPRLWNAHVCLAYPVLGSNVSGDLGLSIAAGGAAGGGAPPARGFVGVHTAGGNGAIRFGTLALTADATHNPFNRYGDYFTVRSNSRCPRTWVATNYGLLGGNFGAENVNARYIEFGTRAEAQCLHGDVRDPS